MKIAWADPKPYRLKCAGQPREFAQHAPATLSELLVRAGSGDIAAFAALYDRTSACLYGVALQVLTDAGSAQESTQEVYLEVWRSACRFDPAHGSPMARLTTLAQRHAVDRVRVEQAHPGRNDHCDIDCRIDGFEPVTNEVADCVERYTLCDGDALLNDGQRESIALAYYGGLTYREVAQHLGVAVPTITSRIRSGLSQLREFVGPA